MMGKGDAAEDTAGITAPPERGLLEAQKMVAEAQMGGEVGVSGNLC